MIYTFIDTSIIIQKNFNFKSTQFNRLVDLSKKNIVRIINTYISDCEIESGIENALCNAKIRLESSKFKSELKVLRNSTPFSILFEKNKEDLFINCKIDLINSFREYKSKSEYINLPINSESPNDVFKLYFKKQYPFGMNKKKNEFPDAFILSSLHRYAKFKGICIYVVSSDNDMKNYCENVDCLCHIDSLEEFLGVASKAEFEEDIIKNIEFEIEKHKTEIENKISYFLDGSDVGVIDVDGFVSELYVKSVHFIFHQLMNINMDDGMIMISGDGEFFFELNITYHDPGTSISEGSYFGDGPNKFEEHYNTNKIVEKSVKIPVVLEIKRFDKKNDSRLNEMFEIINIEFSNLTPIDVSVL